LNIQSPIFIKVLAFGRVQTAPFNLGKIVSNAQLTKEMFWASPSNKHVSLPPAAGFIGCGPCELLPATDASFGSTGEHHNRSKAEDPICNTHEQEAGGTYPTLPYFAQDALFTTDPRPWGGCTPLGMTLLAKIYCFVNLASIKSC
jgi:hypothetical protein